MKDYYDLALLSRLYSFRGEVLVGAVQATFRHRDTPIEPDPKCEGLQYRFSQRLATVKLYHIGLRADREDDSTRRHQPRQRDR